MAHVKTTDLTASEHGAPLITATDLSVRYDKREVLSSVTFALRAGESLAIVGRSGSGKTTLLSCLLGFITPSGGAVRVAGTELAALSRTRRATFRADHIGMVFQDSELIGDLTAQENAAVPGLLSPTHRHEALERARGLLESMGVRPTERAENLSGGERQRTAVARAIINEPQVVLADEPTGSLDVELRDSIADQLFSLPSTGERCLVVVTHDPSVAARATSVLTLRNGRVEQG